MHNCAKHDVVCVHGGAPSLLLEEHLGCHRGSCGSRRGAGSAEALHRLIVCDAETPGWTRQGFDGLGRVCEISGPLWWGGTEEWVRSELAPVHKMLSVMAEE